MKYRVALALLSLLMSVATARAAVFHPADVFADGSWDCSQDGGDVGTVVIAELDDALIGTNGKLVGPLDGVRSRGRYPADHQT